MKNRIIPPAAKLVEKLHWYVDEKTRRSGGEGGSTF
jgi:hypothetical protein